MKCSGSARAIYFFTLCFSIYSLIIECMAVNIGEYLCMNKLRELIAACLL